MRWILKSIFLLGIIIPLSWSRHVQFFRKDYTYVAEYDAFYKLHFDLKGVSWSSAFLACDDEGAKLFYPKTKEEWHVAKNLSESIDLPNSKRDIFVGFHNEYNLGQFITVDGSSTPSPILQQELSVNSNPGEQCILMNIETGSYKIDSCERNPDLPIPFICKRVDDESCPTIDSDYKYMKGSKKCFKVNNRKTMWQDAMHTCFMEGGTLAVTDNIADTHSLQNLIGSNQYYFVGFNRLFHNGDLYTVKGEKLDETKAVNLRDSDSNSPHACGVLKNSLNNYGMYISTTECGERLPFICEIDMIYK
ncbi:hypothetical protein K1T71_009260 [Dendrolimus kikuchii]|uniref:Uncharacterized protein n=1 Tax=Dendrolimus kikuchii TaxID=765133 RepID=A0ACC1CUK7_9NEOP|nr:hypothetical protein K1T71_009260 [Dendrolimus kikuchii]